MAYRNDFTRLLAISMGHYPGPLVLSARAAITTANALLITALLALMLTTTTAMAAPKALKLSDAEKTEISRVEKYLNSISSLQARFLQISSEGGSSQGKLSILRPGMLLLEYDPPVAVEIIADGTWLIYHDKELQQVDRYPLGSTPANILVDKNVSFSSGEFTVTNFQKGSAVLSLTITKSQDPEGSITLIFSDKPLTLRKWIIKDVQGISTTVSLIGTRFGIKLNPDMFQFIDPVTMDDF